MPSHEHCSAKCEFVYKSTGGPAYEGLSHTSAFTKTRPYTRADGGHAPVGDEEACVNHLHVLHRGGVRLGSQHQSSFLTPLIKRFFSETQCTHRKEVSRNAVDARTR